MKTDWNWKTYQIHLGLQLTIIFYNTVIISVIFQLSYIKKKQKNIQQIKIIDSFPVNYTIFEGLTTLYKYFVK